MDAIDIDLLGDTQSIKNNHITDRTRKSYISTLVSFMIWLLDNHPNKLVFIAALLEAKSLDIAIGVPRC